MAFNAQLGSSARIPPAIKVKIHQSLGRLIRAGPTKLTSGRVSVAFAWLFTLHGAFARQTHYNT